MQRPAAALRLVAAQIMITQVKNNVIMTCAATRRSAAAARAAETAAAAEIDQQRGEQDRAALALVAAEPASRAVPLPPYRTVQYCPVLTISEWPKLLLLLTHPLPNSICCCLVVSAAGSVCFVCVRFAPPRRLC